jgi:serine/threonine protein kinase
MAGITNTPPAALGAPPPGGSPALSSPSTVSPSSLLGSGGYGCVLSPPLSNVDETGANKIYPGDVMKVFFKKAAVNKAIRNANVLKSINNPNAPLFSYPITKYTKTYKKKNIPAEFRAKCRITADKLDENIYPVRMPDLGKSMTDIMNDAGLQATVRALPLKNVMNGFLNLLKTIKQINDNNKVHRDVKPQNILVNTTTGNITLIDFDLLDSKEHAVLTGFSQWNSPWETIFWKDEFDFVKKLITDPAFKPFEDVDEVADSRIEVSFVLDDIRARVEIFERQGISKDISAKDYFERLAWFDPWVRETFENPSIKNLDTSAAVEKILENLKSTSILTYDSYFAGISFLTLIQKLYFDADGNCLIGDNCDKLNEIISVILETIDFDPFTRLTANDAIPHLEMIIGGMAGGKRKATRRQKIKRAKPSRKRRPNRSF